MATLTDYKGLDVVEDATGDGGIALTGNFKELADRAPYQTGSNPGTGDDSTQGFAPGDQWLNTSTSVLWACVSNGTGTAVWKSLYKRTATGLELIPAESSESVQVIGSLTAAAGITLPSTAINGLRIDNTSDDVTNYERFSVKWVSNGLQLATERGGTGVSRSLTIASANNTILSSSAGITISRDGTGGPQIARITSAALNSSSLNQSALVLDPTINQSGSAGYSVLLVNPTETAMGSGTRLLADFQLGGSRKASIDTAGQLAAAALSLGAGSSGAPAISVGSSTVGLYNTAGNLTSATLFVAPQLVGSSAGSASTPTFRPSSATGAFDRGMYFPAGALALSLASTDRLVISSSTVTISGGSLTLADASDLVAGTSIGTKLGTSTSQKLGFWNATPVAQQVLATGSSQTVDDVITLLQTLGLCRQT